MKLIRSRFGRADTQVNQSLLFTNADLFFFLMFAQFNLKIKCLRIAVAFRFRLKGAVAFIILLRSCPY